MTKYRLSAYQANQQAVDRIIAIIDHRREQIDQKLAALRKEKQKLDYESWDGN